MTKSHLSPAAEAFRSALRRSFDEAQEEAKTKVKKPIRGKLGKIRVVSFPSKLSDPANMAVLPEITLLTELQGVIEKARKRILRFFRKKFKNAASFNEGVNQWVASGKKGQTELLLLNALAESSDIAAQMLSCSIRRLQTDYDELPNSLLYNSQCLIKFALAMEQVGMCKAWSGLYMYENCISQNLKTKEQQREYRLTKRREITEDDKLIRTHFLELKAKNNWSDSRTRQSMIKKNPCLNTAKIRRAVEGRRKAKAN